MNTGSTRPAYGSRPTILPRASGANGEEAGERGDGPTTTILLVSDRVEDHAYLRRLCDPTRWETREVYGCRKAITAIAEQAPDVTKRGRSGGQPEGTRRQQGNPPVSLGRFARREGRLQPRPRIESVAQLYFCALHATARLRSRWSHDERNTARNLVRAL